MTLVAQQTGVVGMLMYPDPQMDGDITEQNGYRAYPEGPARAPTSIFRHAGNLPGQDDPSAWTVPVMPMSYADVIPLLLALEDQGPRGPELNARWEGGQLGVHGVGYHTGPSPEDIVVHMHNEVNNTHPTLYNVIATLEGEMDDEVVILGNHRDAWTAGAGDPGSGSAALMEVVRAFGAAVQRGWRPRRTILFISWDGHEAYFMGSESWVAQNQEWLGNRTVAYVDVMGAVMGSQFFAKASPLLAPLVRDITRQLPSVNQSVAGQTVLDVWSGSVVAVDGGDALSFTGDGIPTLSFGFRHDKAIDPAFHWHSAFDTVQWMDRFADPSWEYHVRAAQIWGLMAARLAEDPVLPFNVTEYVTVVRGIIDSVQDAIEGRHDGFLIDLEPLNQAVTQLYHAAIEFDAHAVHLRATSTSHPTQTTEIHRVNHQYKTFEQHFRPGGEADTDTHMGHPPSPPLDWTVFPELEKSVQDGDGSRAEKWRDIIQTRIEAATASLRSVAN